ncbi:MAG: DUF3445 domain-containing protein [Rhodobacteraceae bacterium]|nr:DUF3445 domain-containing protein [Paracoccaceae bacterium]MCY4138054.1 DUF3445 domain-containing protein [Paracoccaceae bacterium]
MAIESAATRAGDGSERGRFSAICQAELPVRPWSEERTRRLPGLNPLNPRHWLVVDDVYGEQMSYRDHLVEHHFPGVFACLDVAGNAAAELLELVIETVTEIRGFCRKKNIVTRPDGVSVRLDGRHPLATVGRLVQEDFCILQKSGTEHVLTAGILCFPASWSLGEKLCRPLTSIHQPIPEYDDRVARGVQRVFDALVPERPLWRANNLVYDDPDLFQPRRENARRSKPGDGRKWIRVELQTLRKLPESQAVVFGIHTWVVSQENVGPGCPLLDR